MTDSIKQKSKALGEILSKHCSVLMVQELLKMTSIDQSKISELSGKERNAISKNLSEIEEITLPTFLRYWEAISSSTKETRTLDDTYTPEIQKTIQILSQVKDLHNFKEFILSEKEFFKNQAFIKILERKKYLSEKQHTVGKEIIEILREEKHE